MDVGTWLRDLGDGMRCISDCGSACKKLGLPDEVAMRLHEQCTAAWSHLNDCAKVIKEQMDVQDEGRRQRAATAASKPAPEKAHYPVPGSEAAAHRDPEPVEEIPDGAHPDPATP